MHINVKKNASCVHLNACKGERQTHARRIHDTYHAQVEERIMATNGCIPIVKALTPTVSTWIQVKPMNYTSPSSPLAKRDFMREVDDIHIS